MPAELKKQAGAVDVLHGVAVTDPYRWLEDRDSDQTRHWIADQQVHFEEYFQRLGSLKKLTARVSQLADVEMVDQIGRVADRYFYRKREIGMQQASIFVMDAHDHSERVLISPEEFGPYASVGILNISIDSRLVAYEFKQGGEHTKAIYIVDVETGAILPDHLDRGLARGFAFRIAGDGFYYCHESVAATNLSQKNHEVCFHRLGAPSEDDIVVLELPRNPSSKLILRSDGAMLDVLLYRENRGTLTVDFYAARQDHDDQWRQIFEGVATPFGPFFYQERLYAYRYQDAPNGEIVELDPTTGAFRRTIVPEWKVPVKQCVIAMKRFHVSYLLGTETVVNIWSLDGATEGNLPLESGYTWRLFPRHTNAVEELFLQCESFNRPPMVFRYSGRDNERTVWSPCSTPPTPTRIATQTVSYVSKDGTNIAMTLVGRVDPSLRKDQPVVMTAYGGFGLSLTPQFSTFVSVLLDLGFLFAVPAIRGGNEHGKEWHEAARGRKRQVAFDDFISAADWLNDQGITRPARLGIFGGSNAGILVGAAVTQRPDLFRAALCLAPLLDMIRYHLFDRARVWSSEYGTADDADDFAALLAYSPYHQIREGIDYPAVMFVCGDKDTRCNPAHARKMAARLQVRSAQLHSILVDHSAERGHAPTMPLDVRTDAITKRVAFLCHELEVPFPQEGSYEALGN